MPSIAEIIGENAAKLRDTRGLTQQALADEIGVSRGTIARFETGKGGLSESLIEKISAHLKATQELFIVHDPISATESESAELRDLVLALKGLHKTDLPAALAYIQLLGKRSVKSEDLASKRG